MKKIIAVLLFAGISYTSAAQQYFTKNGRISFFSKAMLENIQADNNQVISVLNTSTGEVQFSLLNNAFHFEKALMEEHFNADYIESDKYPKSTFKGTISNPAAINTSADGAYQVSVTGDLTLHGVTQRITVPGTVTVKGGKLSASCVFSVKPKDYKISIPAAVRNNIAETIQVTVNCSYEKR
jgi:polyisoprenoid-binding protein YceI